jgi:hypothetical protein
VREVDKEKLIDMKQEVRDISEGNNLLLSAWKGEYSKVWGYSEEIKYHLAENEKVLCGMDVRFAHQLWYFGDEDIARTEANKFHLCKRCLTIAESKGLW